MMVRLAAALRVVSPASDATSYAEHVELAPSLELFQTVPSHRVKQMLLAWNIVTLVHFFQMILHSFTHIQSRT